MTEHLPTYEGREPEALRLNFSGKDDAFPDALDLGEHVLLVRVKIKDPAFKENQFGVMRLHQRAVVDHAIEVDEDTAAEMRQEIKRRADEAAGQTSLDEDIDDQIEPEDD